MTARRVFVTGGTGYIGSRVIRALVARGHDVRALVRASSSVRLASGCTPVIGDALDSTTFAAHVHGCDTFVQLVGTPHPSPRKAPEFERVDFVSARESVRAASEASVAHFVYVSVAPSTSVMRAYVDIRRRGEALVREFIGASSGRSATVLRPWYVIGPGHRWPYALIPLYWLLEAIPRTRDRAREFGLVSIDQMVNTIVRSVEAPPASERLRERILAVPDIRRADASRADRRRVRASRLSLGPCAGCSITSCGGSCSSHRSRSPSTCAG